MKDDEAGDRDEMFAEIGVLLARWRDRKINPGVMAARIMQAGLIIAEGLGVPCESVIHNVQTFYGVANGERPVAKA
jgi:hypothetical protein